MGLSSKFIYSQMSKGWQARTLDSIGKKMPKWATGVTRAISVLMESTNPLEILAARHLLHHSGRPRAKVALKQYEAKIEAALSLPLAEPMSEAEPIAALDLLINYMRLQPESLQMVGGRNPAAEILEYAIKKIPAEKLAHVLEANYAHPRLSVQELDIVFRCQSLDRLIEGFNALPNQVSSEVYTHDHVTHQVRLFLGLTRMKAPANEKQEAISAQPRFFAVVFNNMPVGEAVGNIDAYAGRTWLKANFKFLSTTLQAEILRRGAEARKERQAPPRGRSRTAGRASGPTTSENVLRDQFGFRDSVLADGARAKVQYRKKALEHHPDRHAGRPSELAHKKAMQRLNPAWDSVRRKIS